MLKMQGKVIWITGLSGAGKTCLANEVVASLRRDGEFVVALDGDALREVFRKDTESIENYGLDSRKNLALKYSKLCRMIAAQGPTVVIATISLFREVHVWNRANLPNYFEVYLKVPINELRKRDSKGIYRRYDDGVSSNVVGLDIPIDEPYEADWVVDFEIGRTVSTTSEELLIELKRKKNEN